MHVHMSLRSTVHTFSPTAAHTYARTVSSGQVARSVMQPGNPPGVAKQASLGRAGVRRRPGRGINPGGTGNASTRGSRPRAAAGVVEGRMVRRRDRTNCRRSDHPNLLARRRAPLRRGPQGGSLADHGSPPWPRGRSPRMMCRIRQGVNHRRVAHTIHVRAIISGPYADTTATSAGQPGSRGCGSRRMTATS